MPSHGLLHRDTRNYHLAALLTTFAPLTTNHTKGST